MVAQTPPIPKTCLKRIVEPLNAIQQKRQDFFTNAQQLYERLQQFAGQARTAIKRAYRDKHQTERADTEINHINHSLTNQNKQLQRLIDRLTTQNAKLNSENSKLMSLLQTNKKS